MRIKISVCLLFITFFFFIGCQERTPLEPFTDTNSIKGYVKSPNGTYGIYRAAVHVTNFNVFIDTIIFTDNSGYYTMPSMPDGQYDLIISRGAFIDTVSVYIPNEDPAPVSYLMPLKKLGYFKGTSNNFDNMENVVGSLGYTIDRLTLTDFLNPVRLQDYSYIFINSSYAARDSLKNPLIINNLNLYLNNGGRLYASNLAYGLINELRPDINGIFEGKAEDTVLGNIINADLTGAMGSNNVNLSFEFPGWLSLVSLNTSVNFPYIRSTYKLLDETIVINNPVAFYRNEGNKGKLIFTSFHYTQNSTPDIINIMKFFVYE